MPSSLSVTFASVSVVAAGCYDCPGSLGSGTFHVFSGSIALNGTFTLPAISDCTWGALFPLGATITRHTYGSFGGPWSCSSLPPQTGGAFTQMEIYAVKNNFFPGNQFNLIAKAVLSTQTVPTGGSGNLFSSGAILASTCRVGPYVGSNTNAGSASACGSWGTGGTGTITPL